MRKSWVLIPILMLSFLSVYAQANGPDVDCIRSLLNLGVNKYDRALTLTEALAAVHAKSPGISWKYGSPYEYVPENAEFVRRVEEEVVKMFPDGKFGTWTDRMGSYLSTARQTNPYLVQRLIKNIRKSNFPIRETFILAGMYYDLLQFKHGQTKVLDGNMSEMYLRDFDEMKSHNISGYYPKFIFSFREMDIMDLILAREAGVLYMNVKDTPMASFDDDLIFGTERESALYTKHDMGHITFFLDMTNVNLSGKAFLNKEEAGKKLKGDNEKIKKLITSILMIPDDNLRRAVLITLFHYSHETVNPIDGKMALSVGVAVTQSIKGFFGPEIKAWSLQLEDIAPAVQWIDAYFKKKNEEI